MKITAEQIKGAKTYIPTLKKASWVEEMAPKCIDRVSVTSDSGAPMPYAYIENTERKARALMSVLLNEYFNMGLDLTNGLVAADDYDRWAGAHVHNQLERLKRVGVDSSAKDRLFDLMYDYKDTEKRLNAQIYSQLQVMNDPATRIMEMMEMQSTPAALQSAIGQMESLKEAIAHAT